MTESIVISASQVSTWLVCERQWYFKWFRALIAKEGGYHPASVGAFVHKWLEFRYKPGKPVEPQTEMEKFAEHWKVDSPELEESINRALILSTTMTQKYDLWVVENRIDSDLEVLDTERKVKVKMDDESGVELTMKLDVIGKRKSTGMPVIVDHKTVDTIGQGEGHAKLDIQFRTYDLGMFLATGEKHDGVIINELRRVDSTAENSKPPYFNRYEVQYNMDEMRAHWTHLMISADRMRRATARLRAGEHHQKVLVPKPSMQNCRNCDFRVACVMSDDGSDAEGFVQANYKVRQNR